MFCKLKLVPGVVVDPKYLDANGFVDAVKLDNEKYILVDSDDDYGFPVLGSSITSEAVESVKFIA